MTVRQTRKGLQITVSDRSGLAARAGLETGDTLLALNNTRVADTEDVDRVLQRDYNRSTLWMAVGRGRFEYTLTFPLD
jgi:type II secretory pathway component PulC